MSIINLGLFYLTIPDTVNQLLIEPVPVNNIKTEGGREITVQIYRNYNFSLYR
jgi:hypothetical protein